METHDDLLAMAGMSLQEEFLKELNGSSTVSITGSTTTVYNPALSNLGTSTKLYPGGGQVTYIGGTNPYGPNKQGPIGITGPQGVLGITGPQGVPGPSGVPSDDYIAEFMKKLRSEVVDKKDLVASLGTVIDLLIEKKDKTDYEDNALKHLKYAKAYLEKALLDKINQKTDGNSKPD